MDDGLVEAKPPLVAEKPSLAATKPTPSKRKMKTAYQLEILENTYASDAYPSESIRAELSVKLDLTGRQLQLWFCHRRLKDRNNAPSSKRGRKDTTSRLAGAAEAGKVIKKEMSQLPRPPAVGWMDMDTPFMRRHHEPRLPLRTQAIIDHRAISFVEWQLGEPLRGDGPVLGIEFDPLPPDAFGAPLEPIPPYPKQVKRYDIKPYESPEPKFNNVSSTFLSFDSVLYL